MSSIYWTLLLFFIPIIEQGECDSTAYPVIPNHLLECYIDDGIYHRANRLPSSFESFLDLVRKIEGSPTSRNLNARELSLVLLHYLKLDGVQSLRSHSKYFPSNILPFAPSGSEYFKHRLTLVGLVPKIDKSYMSAFNETLTTKEMCNLHFMLSYSIDPYKRDNERCSPLFGDFRRANPEPRSEWDSYQSLRGYQRRYRRSVENGKTRNHLEEEKKEKETLERLRKERIKRSPNDEKNRKLEVEEIVVPKHPKMSKEEKDKFTIGDQELLSESEGHPPKGLQSLIQVGTFGRFGGRNHPRPAHTMDGSYDSDVIPGIPLSECPVVNGVITTPYGPLAIGTVIAGIAAGLNPEDIPPVRLSVDQSELESPSDRVKNTWATTLAGSIADTISSSAMLEMDNLQILKGGWNDSVVPAWYLLSSNQFKHLTEVALRGSLDGLFLGLHAKELTGRFSGFKLSQMLQTYYDNLWGSVGARYRVQLRPKYAPDDLFRKQVHLMSLVLKKQKTNVLTILDHSQVAREAVGRVLQHIQTMDDREKSYIGTFLPTKIDNAINMVAVIDSSWGYENLAMIFQVLRTAQVASTNRNNLTIICGKDGRILLSSDNSVDTYTRFTRDMLLDNCTRGLDFPLIFDTLDRFYRKLYHEEVQKQKMNTEALVSILFPFESLLHDDSFVVQKSWEFRFNFPDVRLMIAANGRSESFMPLVKNEKDLFTLIPFHSDLSLKSTKELAEGIKLTHQRLTRPSCGSYFNDETVGHEVKVTEDVGLGNVVYYRLIPQYFYTQRDQATITIRSKLRAPLTVCHSREMERPAGPTPRGPTENNYRNLDFANDFPPDGSPYGRQPIGEPDGPVECKTITSEVYKIELRNPCEGASTLSECLPLYISLSPPFPETVSITCPTCRLPSNVQYEISATGLTCYNSAVAAVVSPVLLFVLFLFYSVVY